MVEIAELPQASPLERDVRGIHCRGGEERSFVDVVVTKLANHTYELKVGSESETLYDDTELYSCLGSVRATVPYNNPAFVGFTKREVHDVQRRARDYRHSWRLEGSVSSRSYG